jgi:hypothetical protein
VDREALVISQNGPRSWTVELEPGHSRLILRTSTESAKFEVGNTVRLLTLALSRDDESGDTTLTMTRTSEVFVLKGRS